MSISIFDRRTMLAAIEQMTPPPRFLDGEIFRRESPVLTETVDVDIEKGGRTMAPFVSANVQGRVIQREGFDTKSYKLPYIKVKRVTTAEDIMKRDPGENIYQGGMTPAQRAARQLGKDSSDLIEMIDRRIEYMCATALDGGTVTAAGDGVSMSFDYGMDATHKLGVSDLAAAWSDGTNGDPFTDLEGMADLIYQDSGLSPDFVIMSTEAAAAFRNHAKISGNTSAMSMVKIQLGQLDPRKLPNGVTYQGQITAIGVDVYTYNAQFRDPESGSTVRLMPAKKVWMGSRRARNSIHFAGIKDLAAIAAVPYFPKTWVSEDPSARFLMMQSAPLAVLHQPDAFVSAQVLA